MAKTVFYGKPTIYKNIKMKSKLETNFAWLLDKLNIKWVYEPQGFLLKSGIHYTPDFFLFELNTWVETKGLIEEEHIQKCEEFVEQYIDKNGATHCKREIIIFSQTEWLFIGAFGREDLIFGKCSECNSYFFCGRYGIYNCRKCGVHNGDHDIHYLFEPNDIPILYSIEEIKILLTQLKKGKN